MIDKIYDGGRLFMDNYDYVLNNVYMFEWESDLFGITKSKYTVEIEVKISRGDFWADFQKKKHAMFKEARQASKGSVFTNIPNRFYFACPEGMVQPEEVPAYAGLIYCETRYTNFHVAKNAPLIHNHTIDHDKRLLSKYYNTSLNTRNRILVLLNQMNHRDYTVDEARKELKSILRLLK